MTTTSATRRWLRWLRRLFGGLLILLLAVAAFGFFRPRPGDQLTPAGIRRATSRYVTMRDGTRIAVDLRVPANLAPGQRVPAALRATRYLRGVELGPIGRIANGLGLLFPTSGTTAAFSTNGIALVDVDVRGTGASFGQRKMELSAQEIDDLVEILDWITKQSWSNGNVALFGVSYLGNAAELLAARAHPSVKAVVPMFSPWDLYEQPLRPGGLLNLALLELWGRLAVENDSGANRAKGWKGWGQQLLVRGPKQVDEDRDGQLLAQAMASHATANVLELGRALVCRDDATNGITVQPSSPAAQSERLARSGIPILVHSSWLDANYGAAALQRFMALPNPQRLVIGAWSHGGGRDADPFAPADKPATPSHAEQREQVFEFIKSHLQESTSPPMTREIRYVTLGDGTWHTTSRWPPDGFTPRSWFFQEGGRLETSPPATENARDHYKVDFEVSSASTTRWHQLAPVEMAYTNRTEIDRRLLTYTSSPLEEATEVTGSPVLHLHVASTATDGAFHAYLEDVAPDGHVTYVTEGVLRALHRKLATSKGSANGHSIQHSFLRADAAPMVPGEATEIAFELLPTSVLFRKGHRIRMALAGADAGAFERIPAEGAVQWQVYRDSTHPSRLELPMRASSSSP